MQIEVRSFLFAVSYISQNVTCGLPLNNVVNEKPPTVNEKNNSFKGSALKALFVVNFSHLRHNNFRLFCTVSQNGHPSKLDYRTKHCRVRTGPGKPGKSWTFIVAFSKTGKSWKKATGPGKFWKSVKNIKCMDGR